MDFYLSDTSGTKLNSTAIEATLQTDGTYTATLPVTIQNSGDIQWAIGATGNTITADFGGVSGTSDAEGLLDSTGTTTLTVNAAGQDAPKPGEGYTINYIAETITVKEGYEVSTAEIGGTPIGSNSSITDYIGKTVYIRKAQTGTQSPSNWTAVTIPARPTAPAGLGVVNASAANAQDGKIIGTLPSMEYAPAAGSNFWYPCTAGETSDLAAASYLVRYSAATDSFASATTTVTIGVGRAALQITAPTFAKVQAGYAQPEAQPLTIANTGNGEAVISSVSVDNANFIIGGSGSTVSAGGSISTWTIQPAAGLNAGTYTATVTVSYDGGTMATAPVGFTVSRRTNSGGHSGSSSGSGSSYRDREYDFWMEVKDKIEDADSGDTIRVNAKSYDRMPWR